MTTKIALLDGEHLVFSSDDGVLTLTNKRVRYDSVSLGQSQLISITLGSVSSCGLVTKTHPFLLVLAAIAFLAFFSQYEGASFILSTIFLAAYAITRKSFIHIASNGGKAIFAPTKGMNTEAIVTFIEAVEREKLKLP